MKKYLLLAIFTVSVGIQAGLASANSIFGDNFNANFNGETAVGLADETTRFDVFATLGGEDVEVNWVDADSFDFAFIGAERDNLSYSLSDLDFKDASGAVYKIIGASFNRNASAVDEFLESAENPSGVPEDLFFEPTVSFTGNSVTALFSFFDGQLGGDGVRFRYDVILAPEIAPVPLPAPILLLGGSVIALVRLGKKRR
jgi:hypothetical protein